MERISLPKRTYVATAKRPAAGNPNAYGYGCSRPPRGSPARTGRRIIVHLPRAGAWTDLLLTAITRLRQLAVPG